MCRNNYKILRYKNAKIKDAERFVPTDHLFADASPQSLSLVPKMLFIFNIQLNVVKDRSKYDDFNRENSRLWKIIIQGYTLAASIRRNAWYGSTFRTAEEDLAQDIDKIASLIWCSRRYLYRGSANARLKNSWMSPAGWRKAAVLAFSRAARIHNEMRINIRRQGARLFGPPWISRQTVHHPRP